MSQQEGIGHPLIILLPVVIRHSRTIQQTMEVHFSELVRTILIDRKVLFPVPPVSSNSEDVSVRSSSLPRKPPVRHVAPLLIRV